MNPGGGSGWDEPPLDIQIPDDARELDREVLAYRRELRAKRRRDRLRRLAGPFAGRGTVMPLLASILAVCLVAGAMLSVATFSPTTAPADQTPRPTTRAASTAPSASTTARPSTASPSGTTAPGHRFRDHRSGTSRFRDHRFRDHRFRDHRFRDHRFRCQRLRDQPSPPLGEPLSLVDPAEPGRPLRRLALSRGPALTRGSITATIFSVRRELNRGGR